MFITVNMQFLKSYFSSILAFPFGCFIFHLEVLLLSIDILVYNILTIKHFCLFSKLKMLIFWHKNTLFTYFRTRRLTPGCDWLIFLIFFDRARLMRDAGSRGLFLIIHVIFSRNEHQLIFSFSESWNWCAGSFGSRRIAEESLYVSYCCF